MNVSMRPIKRLKPHRNEIMWAEKKKVRPDDTQMKLNQHSYNFFDKKNKLKKIITNIGNVN